MKHNPNPNRLRWRLVPMVLVAMAATCAWGQEGDMTSIEGLTAPLYVGNVEPVLDPFGRPMRGGSQAPDGSFRARVELRRATNIWHLVPPTTNGAAHPFNPLVSAQTVGHVGMNAHGRDSGLFCMAIQERPPTNFMVFARVYNAPTVEEATFYADSAPVRMPKATETTIVLAFAGASPINTNGWSSPDDPFTVSHAELLGIDDRRTDDYDGDGVSNWHEWLAGTAPDDPDSRLVIQMVRRETDPAVLAKEGVNLNKPVRVSWASVPGKKYRLQYVPQLAAIDPDTGEPYAFSGDLDGDGQEDSPIVAGEGEYQIDVWVDVKDTPTGTFRVKLVTE